MPINPRKTQVHTILGYLNNMFHCVDFKNIMWAGKRAPHDTVIGKWVLNYAKIIKCKAQTYVLDVIFL